MPTYYDDDGNPIAAPGKTYYDDDGNPISGASAGVTPSVSVAPESDFGNPMAGLRNVGNAYVGAAKGVGSTVYNLGKMASQVPIPALAGKTPADVAQFLGADPELAAFEGPKPEGLTPQGTAQEVGFGAEQIGEFFIPGAAQAGKLGAVANLAQKAGTVGKMATEGATAAGVAAAQGGDPLAAGAVGAVVPGASAVASKVGPAIMNTKIGARAKQFRRGADPGEGIVDEGLVAGTTGGMWERVQTARKEVGAQIGSVLSTTQKATQHPINIQPFVDGLIDDAVRSLQTAGKPEAAAAVEKIRTGMYEEFAKRGSSPSATNAKELWEVSQQIKDAISYGGDSAIEAGAEVIRKKIRSSIGDVISSTIPAIKPLNKRFANLAEAQSALKAKMDASHGIGNFFRNPVNWIIGGAAGYHANDPAKALAILGMKAGATSMPAVSIAAQAARGLGAAGAAGARAGAGITSLSTRPTDEDVDKLLTNYGRQ